MSLLELAREPFVMLNQPTASDSYGSFSRQWTEGTTFLAAVTLNHSSEARIAAASDSKGQYTVTTKKAVTLRYHDVIRRIRDGAVFRITSNGTDDKTPDTATLDMRQVSAEEWRLPDGQS